MFCAPIGHRQERGRLSRKLAAGGDPARSTTIGPLSVAQGGRGARRPRHLRGRVLRPRRPGDILGAIAAAARHRHGDADLPIPQRVRTSPARHSWAADTIHRARRPIRVGSDPSRRGERRILVRRSCRSAWHWARRDSRSTCGSSPSPRPSRTAAWALRSPAATTSRMRSSAPSLQPRASAFVMSVEGANHAPAAYLIACRHLAAGCLQQWVRNSRMQPVIKVQSDEQKQLHKLDAFNLGDWPQARNLRRRLHLQAGDRRRVRRHLQESRYVDGPLRI